MLTERMPENRSEATAAEAEAPTKREATVKALKGMRRESPAYPFLNAEMPHPNWAALAAAHHQYSSITPFTTTVPSSFSSISFPFSPLLKTVAFFSTRPDVGYRAPFLGYN